MAIHIPASGSGQISREPRSLAPLKLAIHFRSWWVSSWSASPRDLAAPVARRHPGPLLDHQLRHRCRPRWAGWCAAGGQVRDMLPAVPAVAQTITTAAIEADETAPVIVTITGAPGDGNTALAAAIRDELARVGLPISDKARGPKCLDVHVTVGNARDDGNQPVEVEWWLRNPEGKNQGTVMQRVELPEEQNGPWGNDATYAARYSAQGILRLLPQ
jgi:hypothetical protein